MILDSIFSFVISFESSILAALNFITFLALLGVIYYSARILLRMRLGRLEKGWRFVTQGLVLLSAGFIFLTLEHTLPRSSVAYFLLDSAGTTLSLGGIIFMLLGLRSHLTVWIKKPSKSLEQSENAEGLSSK